MRILGRSLIGLRQQPRAPQPRPAGPIAGIAPVPGTARPPIPAPSAAPARPAAPRPAAPVAPVTPASQPHGNGIGSIVRAFAQTQRPLDGSGIAGQVHGAQGLTGITQPASPTTLSSQGFNRLPTGAAPSTPSPMQPAQDAGGGLVDRIRMMLAQRRTAPGAGGTADSSTPTPTGGDY